MTAGYSGTPLIKKFGTKPGFRVRFVNPPGDMTKRSADRP